MWVPQFIRDAVIRDYDKTNDSVLKLRMIQLKNENDQMTREIKALNDIIKRKVTREVIPFDVGDAEPTDAEKRKVYVSGVAGSFTDLYRPKIMKMIAVGRAVLEQDDNTREDDLRVKGMLFGLWEFIRWGDTLVSEYKSWLADQEQNHGNENQGSK